MLQQFMLLLLPDPQTLILNNKPIAKIYSTAVCCNSSWTLYNRNKYPQHSAVTMPPVFFPIILPRKNFAKLRDKSIVTIGLIDF